MDARLQLQRRRRAQVLLGLWVAILLLAVLFREVLFPFVMGALLAYLIAPAVRWLSDRTLFGRRLNRLSAVLLLYALGFALLFLGARLILPNLYRETLRLAARLTTTLEGSSADLQQAWLNAHQWMHSHGLEIGENEDLTAPPPRIDIAEALREWPQALQGRLLQALGIGRQVLRSLFGAVYTTILILVTGALFVLVKEQIFAFVRTLMPDRGGSGLDQLSLRLERRLSGVVRGQLTICLINGALTLVGLLLFRVEFPFVLAAQATVFSLIPIFGTFISSVPILLVALQGGLGVGISMLGWILAIHGLEAYLLNPKILGGAARIHPLVILFALVAGEHSFGLWGAFLAAPVAAVAVATYEQAEAWAESGAV